MGKSVQLGFIDGGQVEGGFAADLTHLALSRHDRVDGLLRFTGHQLAKQRNELVSAFLDGTDSQWLFMVDTDHRLSLNAFDLMLGAADADTTPVISALCFAAYPGGLYPIPVPTIYRDNGDGRWSAFHDYPPNQIVPVDAAGAGCLLMHRSALELVRQRRSPSLSPKWCWFVDGPAGDDWVSEDLTFMQRLRAAGIPVHAHTGAVLPHIKTYVLSDAHHRDMLAAAVAESGD